MRSITERILLIMFLCVAHLSNAQDPHNSQYFNLPVYYNPASAGQGVEHIRLTGIYRNQWPSLSNPITIQGIQFDKQVSKVGLGVIMLKNSAGPSSLQRLQLGGTISYRLKFGVHEIASGINIGFVQKSFNPSKMTFDDQYLEDGGYNANNPTSEVFGFTHVTRPDLGAGFLWTMNENNSKWQPFAGISMMHINKAKEVFIETENSNAVKMMYQAGTRYIINKNLEIKPSFMMQQQQFSTETLIGCMATKSFEERNKAEAGIYIRKSESAIFYGGYQWNSLMVGASYDMSISNHISGPGAFELTLTYIPRARVKNKKEAKEKTQTTVPVKIEKENDLFANDIDKDGTPDGSDNCPNEAGLKSNHGCPLPDDDADGDGVLNKSDACPYLKGLAATNGCPDLDGDGVIDSKDHCPTRKGLKENNGCPLSEETGTINERDLSENVVINDAASNSIKNDKTPTVRFYLNQASIKSYEIIEVMEPIANQLKNDLSLQVNIAGFTDEEGNEQYNMILSQKRADVVKEYLVKHGINADRIQSVGYGFSKPVNTNGTDEGRSQNRRTEIYISKKP